MPLQHFLNGPMANGDHQAERPIIQGSEQPLREALRQLRVEIGVRG